MSMRIVYVQSNGILAVVTPADRFLAKYPTLETGLAAVAAKCVPKGVEYQVVDEADLPQDRKDRANWKINIKDVVVETEPTVERKIEVIVGTKVVEDLPMEGKAK